jgi:hypothetical protein
MYLASATRSDISYAMSKLSRFVSKLGDDHWRALERVLWYLKGTMTYDIHYTGNPKVLEGYCDANWISDADELRHKRICVSVWRWRCFLEVLQANYLNIVYNGSKTHSIRHCWG